MPASAEAAAISWPSTAWKNASPKPDLDIVALDDALNDLARIDPQQSRVVELRFFSGLSIEDTAQVLGISESTVKRDWNTARAWLYRELDRTSISMTPERWKQIRVGVRGGASRWHHAERAAFLDQACAGDLSCAAKWNRC